MCCRWEASGAAAWGPSPIAALWDQRQEPGAQPAALHVWGQSSSSIPVPGLDKTSVGINKPCLCEAGCPQATGTHRSVVCPLLNGSSKAVLGQGNLQSCVQAAQPRPSTISLLEEETALACLGVQRDWGQGQAWGQGAVPELLQVTAGYVADPSLCFFPSWQTSTLAGQHTPHPWRAPRAPNPSPGTPSTPRRWPAPWQTPAPPSWAARSPS